MLLGRWTLDSSPIYVGMDLLSRVVSPYDLNPLGKNPLRDILAESNRFRAAGGSRRSSFSSPRPMCGLGEAKCSRTTPMTPDVLLASACLPTMFQAIEIDGEAYWDGGYSGNPTLTPLIRECKSQDTILVPINPVERPGTSRAPRPRF